MPPLSLGRAESHGFEHMRSGTLSLFAALNAAPGESWIKPPSVASVPIRRFSDPLVSDQPEGHEIHVICDNVSGHKTAAIGALLSEHPQVAMHFTSTYSS